MQKDIINHLNGVEKILKSGPNQREEEWTESIAVGEKEVVMENKAKPGSKAIGRKELENSERYVEMTTEN
jgi:hypothetical protein